MRLYSTVWNTSVRRNNNNIKKAFWQTKKSFRPSTTRWMVRTTLDCVRPVSLDICRVERCVCVWSSWLSTSLSTAVTFTAVHACFGPPLSCIWSVLRVSRTFFSKVLTHSFFQFFFENSFSMLCEPYSSNWYKFLLNALSSALNSTFHYWYFVTILKILFTIISSAFVYRHRMRI